MINFSSIFSKIGRGSKRIYLDYASVTPVDERVLRYASKISKDFPANPNSLYKEGLGAHKQLESARAKVAKHLDAHADEIIFTSGGTESNNLAIKGVMKAAILQVNAAWAKESAGSAMKDCGGQKPFKPHVVSSVIEHPSVRELLFQCEKEGICDVTLISVNAEGIVDLKELKKALRPETILVSIMYVNNEIGTIQPIAEISKIVRHYKKEKRELSEKERASTGSTDTSASENLAHVSSFHLLSSYPYVHTDACQAALFCPLRIPTLGVDMMTLDSAKFYGPRGVGALYIKRALIQSRAVAPILVGGSHEQELRAGTENVAGISGFAYAMDLAVAEKDKESARLGKMRDFLVREIKAAVQDKKIPEIIFNGSYEKDAYGNPKRVPNNLNICMPGMDAEFAVLRLDVRGMCVSSVTSCRSKNEDSTSYVVEALSKGGAGGAAMESLPEDALHDCGKSSLRITLGRFTTNRDIKRARRMILDVLGRQ